MPSINIFLSPEEHAKIERLSMRWDIYNYEVIRRLIQEYDEFKVEEDYVKSK